MVNNTHVRRRQEQIGLGNYTRGMTSGVGVLTKGWVWEIYDLGRRTRNFADQREEVLVLDPNEPEHAEQIADTFCR